MLHVKQLENKNQFVIYDEENNRTYFQSYNTLIAKLDKGVLFLNANYWDYSKTTLKHLYIFIVRYCPYKYEEMLYTIKNNKRASIQKAIEQGLIKKIIFL